ncbi:MipA/OmpV family protein [Tropicimonas isoalkanivorans]|uniref:MltA-interacting protein MipA n=1 Tax=Tropicimonas isoalkanivorans TaxID=441112 RepID=A0A1I1MX48_9RHOB|nr:MipA/OmpV family protein [Tropicimonas isoalkanivorans]SFC89745.1 MltA-interacting protein MipA [Tropicimonas isoalkanivorans]
MFIRSLAFVALLVAAGPLSAQETPVEPSPSAKTAAPLPLSQIDPNKNVVLRYEIRAGAQVRPAYFGSDEYVYGPDFAIKFDYAKLRGFGEYGSLDGSARPSAIGLRGSLRFIGERDSSEFDELDGLDDIDPTLELGLGVIYRERNFEAFGDVRYGVIGTQDFAGELGMDAIAYPSDRWELRLGPRVTYGDSGFADTYFGVSGNEAAASGLPAYDADGGLLGAGFEASARYRLNDLWGVEASVRADRLLNDAADSPITDMGSEDQVRFRIGVTRELILQF